MKSGYKQTDIGIIPKDWDTPTLGELFSFKNGLNKAKEYFGHGTPIVNYMDVYKRPGLFAADIKGRVQVNKQEQKNFEVCKGDIFFTRTSETVDEIGIVSVILDEVKDTVFSGFVLRAHPKDDRLENNFKKYCFTSSSIRKQIISKSTYTTRALTNGRVLSNVIMARPQRREQKVIGDTLTDIDTFIATLDMSLSKKRNIKIATMQQLLTGKKRLPDFNKKWEFNQIGKFADCTSGGTPSTLASSYWGGPIRWMNSGELNLKIVDEVKGRITEEGLQNSSTKLIPAKSVLIGLAGQGKTRGTVAMNTVELCTNQSIAAILPNSTFVPEYLYYNLDSRYDELRGLSTGDGGRGGLNLSIIKSLLVPLPEILEQSAIATILMEMDAEIASLEVQRFKLKGLKQGMLQQLLTGNIRLV